MPKRVTPISFANKKSIHHSSSPTQEGLMLLKSEPMWKMPTAFTSFIGREQAVGDICVLLQSPDIRLLTLLGTGGIGKTRLSISVASQMRSSFSDGICFVSLAAITEPQLVVSTIAETLGVQQVGKVSLFEHIQAFLRNKHLLLLLDNFEQVVSAAPLVEELLAACPAIKIVVTSRVVLHVQVEHVVSVSPLALPPRQQHMEQEMLAHNESVALFVQRAQAVQPQIRLTAKNVQVIAEICTRLEGLPLTIELAAARIALLSPQALLARLTQRLDLLTGGARTLPSRQRTLRNTLQWSYDLLSDEEQKLFRRLSVFVGGWTLEAAEALYGREKNTSIDILNMMTSLLEKSLIQRVDQDEDEPRFLMLETLREYGLERLNEYKESEDVQRTHAAYYFALAYKAKPYLFSKDDLTLFALLEREYENIRVALDWAVGQKETTEAQLVYNALLYSWLVRSRNKEIQYWTEKVLNLPSEDASLLAIRARAQALSGAIGSAYSQGRLMLVQKEVEERMQLYQMLGDVRGIAGALKGFSYTALEQGDWQKTLALCDEEERLMQQAPDVVVGEADYLVREVPDSYLKVDRHLLRAYAYCLSGDYTHARSEAEEMLLIAKQIGGYFWTLYALHMCAYVAFLQQDYAHAQQYHEESFLRISANLNDKYLNATNLLGWGKVVAAQGQFVQATQLWAIAERLREAIGVDISSFDRPSYEYVLAQTREQLGKESFEKAWADGRLMTVEQVFALEKEPHITTGTQQVPTNSRKSEGTLDLTARQSEILRLVAQGLSDAQIAEQLVISPRTVNTHLTTIYQKIGVTSRSAATRYAFEHSLL